MKRIFAVHAPPSPDTRAEVGLIFAVWTLVGLLFGSAAYFRAEVFGEPISVFRAAATAAMDVYTWALISLVALWATRRFPLERGRWARSAAAHAALGLLLVTLRAFAAYAFYQGSGWYPERTLVRTMYSFMPPNFVSYWMLVGVAHAVEYARRFHERTLSAAHLEAQLARAQMQMLKIQLHPHFLFNTLHAISTLVHRDPDAAERTIASLSELLRSTLAHQQEQEVSVAEEMDLLEPYLEIEKTRLGDRLDLRIEVDPDARAARVPHLILQPIVENAIRHGIAPRRRGGRIEISVARKGEWLWIRVADDGRGFRPGATAARSGVGITNTRARLQQLHGREHRFQISTAPDDGTRVEIVLPYRLAEPARAPLPARQET